MPLKNYFHLYPTYKEITHTKKVSVGDWIVVWSRKKVSHPITLVSGKLVSYTKSGSLTLEIQSSRYVKIIDPSDGSMKTPERFVAGTPTYKLQEGHIRAWQWVPDAVPGKRPETPDPLSEGICRHFLLYR